LGPPDLALDIYNPAHIMSVPCTSARAVEARGSQQINHQLRLLVILFVSALSAERSFSKLKVIKIYDWPRQTTGFLSWTIHLLAIRFLGIQSLPMV